MFTSKEPPRLEIPVSTVESLVKNQFPQWGDLPIRPVDKSGWDNRTFHLGDKMSVRLPSAERYVHQVKKEHKWLPILATGLSTPIPRPLALGEPSECYPWHWSVYEWIEGENAETLDKNRHEQFAKELAEFLINLHKLDTTDGPTPGPFYRGASPSYYDSQTREAVAALKGCIDVEGALATWETAISSEWENDPVWVHGDLSSGNILVKNGKLNAVIDFGSSCVGDPACDFVIAWTFLSEEVREIFKAHLNFDPNTWARARGWALWKALITLADLSKKDGPNAETQKEIIHLVIDDFRNSQGLG